MQCFVTQRPLLDEVQKERMPDRKWFEWIHLRSRFVQVNAQALKTQRTLKDSDVSSYFINV